MIRPFKLVNNSEVSLIKDISESIVARWCNTWCRNESVTYDLYINTEYRPQDQSESPWIFGSFGENNHIGVCWSGDFPDEFYSLMLKSKNVLEKKTSISTVLENRLYNRAITHLVEMLIYELTFDRKSVKPISDETLYSELEINRAGSGNVFISVVLNEKSRLTVRFNVSCMKQKIPADAPSLKDLSSTLNTIGQRKVKIKAIMGTAELNVNALTNLSIGDVITIDKKLTERVELCIDDRQFCEGILGKLENNLSVKIE